MLGLMQDWPLLVHTILDHAASYHGNREIVTRTTEGPISRTTYQDLDKRARALAHALQKLGVKQGDVLGVMAWNTARHMELWYGAMGIGAVAHTLNPRLFADQLAYIINHAQDSYVFLDLTFVPILEGLQDMIETSKGFVIMTDQGHMPETSLENVICYEELLAKGDSSFQWLALDENTACGLCYTSGTTGNPKGVLYSHRSNVLHALATVAADALAITSSDCVLPVVPMFHANCWSLVYSVPMAGAKLVMPGGKLDGESVFELLDKEQVTLTAGVPTVWFALLQYLEETGNKLPYLERIVIGGAACPPSMLEAFENKYDTQVIHAWGMTEMSPLGSLCKPVPDIEHLDEAAKAKIMIKQGRPPYMVEMKVVDDEGGELPHDGETFGHLMVRGPAVAEAYMRDEGGDILDPDGWFDTSDVATMDQYGYMEITDRSKDVIKSGGEWISSIELENLAVGHPDVAEAAVIGITHPKWNERPLLVIVKAENADPSKQSIMDFMTGKTAKWWLPDDVVFVDEIPHTATGKILKTKLREQFGDYKLPDA